MTTTQIKYTVSKKLDENDLLGMQYYISPIMSLEEIKEKYPKEQGYKIIKHIIIIVEDNEFIQ